MTNRTIQTIQTAYWALGKKLDHGLLPFFIASLQVEIRRDMEAAYQIMIALDNLGLRVFSRSRTGYSSSEHELNLEDALAFLKSIGS